ncbi:MAG: alpha/beta hydrolase [Janthinobacterium lividum]
MTVSTPASPTSPTSLVTAATPVTAGTPGLSLLDVATWEEPRQLNARGTVFVLTGRGETPEVYQRFGSRLAADAYRVVAISASDHLDPATTEQVADLVRSAELPSPKVLLGSDAGARAALLLAGTLGVDGVVAAGLPVAGKVTETDWQTEISARTACPNHQRVLQRSTRGSLFHEVPAVRLSGRAPQRPAVPVLALHGSADTLSPLPRALAWYAEAGITDVAVVEGGLHDILNDVTHRSVAATILLWLERLRVGPALPVVVGPAAGRG